MTCLFKPIKLILEFYYMSNGLTFAVLNIFFAKFVQTLGYDLKIACAKFQRNWFIIDGEKMNVAQGNRVHPAFWA